MAEKRIENCNSCDTAEKLAELPVLVLAKFSEDLVDMAKENWCESHIIMLRRLILAVQQDTRYDETLLPEEEAWNTRKPIEKVVEQRNKAIDEFLERCKSGVQNGELYDFVKWNNWNDCACEWFEKIAELLKGSEQE